MLLLWSQFFKQKVILIRNRLWDNEFNVRRNVNFFIIRCFNSLKKSIKGILIYVGVPKISENFLGNNRGGV